MNRTDAVMQYQSALKRGQKYCKNAVGKGVYPYLPVFSEITDAEFAAVKENIGVVEVPSELIVGTYAPGRSDAFSADFMPLLPEKSEFAVKWINLCTAHLSDEGIRDPIICIEYMGKFYVKEGNKRVSVLKSYNAPTISAEVTRLIPMYSDDRDVQIYYEFLHFYAVTGIYGVQFNHRLRYAKLIAKLGYDEDHVWTKEEKNSFCSGYYNFKSAFDKVCPAESTVTAGEALLFWLGIYTFDETKAMTQKDIAKNLTALWTKIEAENDLALDINTEPTEKSQSIISKLFKFHSGKLNTAFIYGYSPDVSEWTKAHDSAKVYLEEKYGEKISATVYTAENKDYFKVMEKAVGDGANVIFATLPTMIGAARKISALYPDVKLHVCSLSRPHAGVRNYYCRTYESKFIAGAIAGAVCENDVIGYIANYPIMGVPASVNAFALGAKLTNPRARIVLGWSCTGDGHISEMKQKHISIISGRDASVMSQHQNDQDLGLFRLLDDGSSNLLAVPVWNWCAVYENIILSIWSGAWNDDLLGRAINYWWGMSAGVSDICPTAYLPSGVKALSQILKDGIVNGSIKPFFTELYDNCGTLRNDGKNDLRADEIMSMDWLLDNVEGTIPPFDTLIEESKETVRLLGVYRHSIAPDKEDENI